MPSRSCALAGRNELARVTKAPAYDAETAASGMDSRPLNARSGRATRLARKRSSPRALQRCVLALFDALLFATAASG